MVFLRLGRGRGVTVQRSVFGTDRLSAQWQTLERSMLSLEASMSKRDAECFTGTVEWLKGLHRRHAGQVIPRDRVR